MSKALKDFIDEAKAKFDDYREEDAQRKQEANIAVNEGAAEGEDRYPKRTALWDLLMKADNMSVRQFLTSWVYPRHFSADSRLIKQIRHKNGGVIPDGPGYNFNTIEWLETATL